MLLCTLLIFPGWWGILRCSACDPPAAPRATWRRPKISREPLSQAASTAARPRASGSPPPECPICKLWDTPAVSPVPATPSAPPLWNTLRISERLGVIAFCSSSLGGVAHGGVKYSLPAAPLLVRGGVMKIGADARAGNPGVAETTPAYGSGFNSNSEPVNPTVWVRPAVWAQHPAPLKMDQTRSPTTRGCGSPCLQCSTAAESCDQDSGSVRVLEPNPAELLFPTCLDSA